MCSEYEMFVTRSEVCAGGYTAQDAQIRQAAAGAIEIEGARKRRRERVEALRVAVGNGTYRVPTSLLATCLMRHLPL